MHQYRNEGTFCAMLILIVLYFAMMSSAHAETMISEQEMKKAKVLFSGPTEEDYYKTDEMLISATGSLKPVFFAPSVAMVISKEDIETMGATTLDEILETVPGLHVMPSPSVGPFLTNYSIRGILTNLNPQVLVLINGIPIKEQFNASRSYRFMLPVSMISRVEVIRGPGSAVHGADAFAGTINVITKDGQEINGFQAGGRYGSFQTSDLWFQYGGKHADWNIVAGVERVQNGSDPDAIIDSDLQTTLDGAFGTTASRAGRAMNMDRTLYQFNLGADKGRWNLNFWGTQIIDAGVGIGAAPVLDTEGYINTDRYTFDVRYEDYRISSDWSVDGRVYYTYHKYKNNFTIFPAGATLPIGTDGNAFTSPPAGLTSFTNGYIGNPSETDKTTSMETVANYTGLAQHNVRLAVGHTRIRSEFGETKNFGPGVLSNPPPASADGTLTDVSGTGFIFAPNNTRKISYLSLQDEWSLTRKWELTAGVRYDDYSDFGSTTNPRLALVWQTRYNLVTKLLYGRAFRAPSIGELFGQNNPSINGNANVKPEVIDTTEFAIDYRPTVDLILNANVFYYEIDGLIEFTPDSTGANSTAQNTRNQKGHGIELEADWKASSTLRVRGNISWQKSVDKATNYDVPNAPQLQAYSNVNWKFKKHWSIDGQVFWIGDRTRALGDNRASIKDYSLVNLTLRRKNIIDSVDLAFAIRNAFNTDAREPSSAQIPNDSPLNDRSLWLEIRSRI